MLIPRSTISQLLCELRDNINKNRDCGITQLSWTLKRENRYSFRTMKQLQKDKKGSDVIMRRDTIKRIWIKLHIPLHDCPWNSSILRVAVCVKVIAFKSYWRPKICSPKQNSYVVFKNIPISFQCNIYSFSSSNFALCNAMSSYWLGTGQSQSFLQWRTTKVFFHSGYFTPFSIKAGF